MITIKNTQRSIPLNIPAIRRDVEHILRIIGYADFEVSVWFTSSTMIHKYNKTYRHKDKPTDILSFPCYPDLKPGVKIKVFDEDEKNLGDLILAPMYIKKDLPRWDMDFDQRIRVLLVHGICHLLGYDHEDDKDYALMKRKEESILRKLAE